MQSKLVLFKGQPFLERKKKIQNTECPIMSAVTITPPITGIKNSEILKDYPLTKKKKKKKKKNPMKLKQVGLDVKIIRF